MPRRTQDGEVFIVTDTDPVKPRYNENGSIRISKERMSAKGHRDENGVYFYGGPFSNFAHSPFVLDGHTWRTVEHYFQAQKAMSSEERKKIRTAQTPMEAKKLGQRVRLRSDWENVKYDVMLCALRAKFAQNPSHANDLLETGDKNLYEDSPTDFEWGCRNNGKNLLGKALMKVRSEMQRNRA